MTDEQWGWLLFGLFIFFMMALDLGVFHRQAHEVKFKEALTWSGIWVALALGFNSYIFFWNPRGTEAASEFLFGYLLEQSLSVDNLFVFLLVFHYFQVDSRYQHRILFWGILGALCMRAAFIGVGVALIRQFHWVLYVFGVLLVYSGIKLALEKDKKVEPEKNPVLRLFRRFVPVTPQFVESKFFVRVDGRLMATPLFVVLLVIETTDVVFAIDSIPLIFGITEDPFIIYTSNVFAIMGLRSMYFALAGMMYLFHYLHYGLALVLSFVGIKMLLPIVGLELPKPITLGVVGAILLISVTVSLLFPLKSENGDAPATVPEEGDGSPESPVEGPKLDSP